MWKKKKSHIKLKKSIKKDQPWGKFKLLEVWDYETAKKVYALYRFELVNIDRISGVTGDWVEKGRGDKAWATRTAKHLDIEVLT